MPKFATGDRSMCQTCGREIEYVGPSWRHVGAASRHPGKPVEFLGLPLVQSKGQQPTVPELVLGSLEDMHHA